MTAGRDVESINEEAVAAAWQAIDDLWVRLGGEPTTAQQVRAALAAAVPLLRLSDVPGLERQLRDQIAEELREYRAGIIRDDEIPADPRERDPYDRGYCSGLEHAAQWVNRGSEVSS